MKRLIFFLAVPVFLISCQKEYTSDITDSPTTACNTYFPLTTGSTWTLVDSLGNENTITIITPDTTIDGKTFKRANQNISGQTATTFSREEDGYIYSYADLTANGAATGNALINPLRTNAAIGDKWEDNIVLNGIDENLEYEMLEKNVKYSVNSLNFDDVIHIKYDVKVNAPPIFSDQLVQTTDVWFAKCVGTIESKTSSFTFGVPSYNLDYKIKSYSIK